MFRFPRANRKKLDFSRPHRRFSIKSNETVIEFALEKFVGALAMKGGLKG